MQVTRALRNSTLAAVAIGLLAPAGATLAEEAEARPPAKTLSQPATPTQKVDNRGFIRRWLVLEPIPTTGILTESAVQDALKTKPLSSLLEIPSAGATANIEGQPKWHALDTKLYNLNLYHFAWPLSKPTSNVVFWAVTTIDSPREMKNVRLAIGSNAASNWWLNGERVVELYNDRQTVIDDGVSKRITLKQGHNIIVAAIVNGGGATDFCARFLDENDQPITGLTVSLQGT
jgi:hypothetical protein